MATAGTAPASHEILAPCRAGVLACAVLLALALLLASCAARSGSSAPRPGAFIASEYAPYDTAGTGEITGSGSATPEGGLRQTTALRWVVLRPVTSWSRRWWERSVLLGDPLGDAESRAAAYLREVVADSTGHFRFDRLPAGNYFLQSSVLWSNSLASRPRPQVIRVVLGKQVALAAGQHLEVVLDSLRLDANGSEMHSAEHRH